MKKQEKPNKLIPTNCKLPEPKLDEETIEQLESYLKYLRQREFLRWVEEDAADSEAIRKAIEEDDGGPGIPAEEVFEELELRSKITLGQISKFIHKKKKGCYWFEMHEDFSGKFEDLFEGVVLEFDNLRELSKILENDGQKNFPK